MENQSTDQERLQQQQIRQTLLAFVEETHFDLVVRLTHFYDFFIQTYGSKGSAEDIWRVLTFLGWQRLTKNQIQKFIRNLDPCYVCNNSTQLSRYSIRHIFREWLLHVCTSRELLHECFRHFDLDGNGYLNKEEIIKILYRTTEEERINLIQDVIENLDNRIYFDDILKETKLEQDQIESIGRKQASNEPKSAKTTQNKDRKLTITKVITEPEVQHTNRSDSKPTYFLINCVLSLYYRAIRLLSNYLFLLLLAYILYILIMMAKLPPDFSDFEH